MACSRNYQRHAATRYKKGTILGRRFSAYPIDCNAATWKRRRLHKTKRGSGTSRKAAVLRRRLCPARACTVNGPAFAALHQRRLGGHRRTQLQERFLPEYSPPGSLPHLQCTCRAWRHARRKAPLARRPRAEAASRSRNLSSGAFLLIGQVPYPVTGSSQSASDRSSFRPSANTRACDRPVTRSTRCLRRR